MIAWFFFAVMQMSEEGAAQNVIDESRLATPGKAGHTDEISEGKTDINILQVVFSCSPDDERSSLPPFSPALGPRSMR